MRLKSVIKNGKWLLPLVYGLICILIVIVGYEIYRISLLEKDNSLLRETNASLEEEILRTQAEKENLLRQVRDHEYTIETFSTTIAEISNTVGTLEKLSKTDSELLLKYSKVYFLNENYSPTRLISIDSKYLYNKDIPLQIHSEVEKYLTKLLQASEDSGVHLLVASAFRSFGTQAALKTGYTSIYGSGANQFSADQGYSEHQLGTTVDFTTLSVGGIFSQFESDPAYRWLVDNAYKYGFILSYPENNTYYKFEPWHWRFVGMELATKLKEEGKNFYDLDQREIDEYLIKIFD